jgi:sulfite reductase (NADPH) hemoprotein beta-component
LAPTPVPGRVIGPSFAADEVVDAIEALLEVFRTQRLAGERFIDAVHRLGLAPFKQAAHAVRRSTARPTEETTA